MKKFIISLFFVIFAIFNVCGENVKGEIILPKIERKFVDSSAQNPLKATNVEGIFIVNPYKGNENRINNEGYRIFVLDKNSNELLYVIEDVVFDWHPHHNNGWGGRVVEDDFCLLTKDCVEYIIKGNKFNCEVHSYLEGKYLTEDGEDLLHPVIRDDIDEDIKKIEQVLVDYVLYPDLVERGFDVHRLDNMKIDGEMFEYIESFFRPNEEKGWLPLDNHHSFSIRDENKKWYDSTEYRKHVKFSKEYGTKDELLKKGYVENETMFYYPSNGEKDWRVGKWTWFNWKGTLQNFNGGAKLNFDGMKEIYKDLYVLETKKSYVIRYDGQVDKYINENIKSIPKKDYLIIDLLNGNGGWPAESLKFAEIIKSSKTKKIIVLIDNASSAGERLIGFLKEDKRVICIGENTNGRMVGFDPKQVVNIKNEDNRVYLTLSTYINSTGKYISDPSLEGIGYLPDIWIANDSEIDIMKNIWNITKDYELKTSNKEVLQALEEIKK